MFCFVLLIVVLFWRRLPPTTRNNRRHANPAICLFVVSTPAHESYIRSLTVASIGLWIIPQVLRFALSFVPLWLNGARIGNAGQGIPAMHYRKPCEPFHAVYRTWGHFDDKVYKSYGFVYKRRHFRSAGRTKRYMWCHKHMRLLNIPENFAD